jgi:two-component system, NtrC family, nitrogen regulation sensor histidine kinase NtrY
MRKRLLLYSAIIAGLAVLAAAFVIDALNSRTPQQVAAQASERIEEKGRFCDGVLSQVLRTFLSNPNSATDDFYNDQQVAVFIFREDSLLYWNNAGLPYEPRITNTGLGHGTLTFNHGLYYYTRKDSAGLSGVAMIAVKREYELQNAYLSNAFERWTGIPPEIELAKQDSAAVNVKADGESLFSIKGRERLSYDSSLSALSACLAMISILLLLLSAVFNMQRLSITRFLIITAGVVLLRLAMVILHVPDFFYRSFFYDVHVFGNASSVMNAFLGDMILNAVGLLFLTLLWTKVTVNNSRVMIFHCIYAAIVLFTAFAQFGIFTVSIVANSTLSFDFMNIFSISPLAFVALAAPAFCSFTILIVIRRLAEVTAPVPVNRNLLVFLLILAIGIILAATGLATMQQAVLMSIAAIVLYYFSSAGIRLITLLAVHTLLFSFLTSYLLNEYIERNEEKELEVLAFHLGEKQDPLLEHEFTTVSAKIAADEGFRNLINILPATAEEIPVLLNQKYFNSYFNRYTIDYAVFDARCNPVLPVREGILANEGFFEDQIRRADSTSSGGLFFVRNFRKNSRYIGRVSLGEHRLYLFMEPKQMEEAGTFPELLLDRSQQRHAKIGAFSYAVYREGQNVFSYGAYNYPLELAGADKLFATEKRFSHHLYNIDETTTIAISRPARTTSYLFTFNSYILLFYIVLSYFIYIVYAALYTAELRSASLTRRIQTVIVLLLLTAITVVGVTSGKIVSSQFDEDNRKQLKEKTGVILDELSTRLRPEIIFDEGQKDLVNLNLTGFARLFKTDISLFRPDGSLFNTSQPRLYQLGLASQLANPWAIWRINHKHASGVLVDERAGTLDFLSYYAPMHDASRKLTGYINLPYFARQNDLVNELSGIISTFINVYVILFILSLLAGIVLSGYITRPLRLIQQEFSRLSLGGNNQKISWRSQDEIGRLVAAYNEMLAKLDESAALLAKSEREGAWREMAKQVAHEIKNPLTPMKLNLQYLQHLSKTDELAFKEKFMKTSSGIIEQINSLATIASEFSSLARLPGTQLEKVDLREVIANAVELFDENKTLIRNRIDQPVTITGDREQCLRVFNNLLKNAVEAVADSAVPQIEIYEVRSTGESIVIGVKDNGTGIDEDQALKIFTPNFTTRSNGSGLGLAMVKNIMEGIGGSVWFDSQKDKGATFYLSFRKLE